MHVLAWQRASFWAVYCVPSGSARGGSIERTPCRADWCLLRCLGIMEVLGNGDAFDIVPLIGEAQSTKEPCAMLRAAL